MFYLRTPERDARRQLAGNHGPRRRWRGDRSPAGRHAAAAAQPKKKTERLAEELLADPKERAEHVMLVDLGRNDVGRVAQFGSVEDLRRDGHRTLQPRDAHHLERHRPAAPTTATPSTPCAACLPAGTVSGAPKVRAMEIIDEIEPHRRGPYAGAVGYIDFAGNMDTCIALRTIVVQRRHGLRPSRRGHRRRQRPGRRVPRNAQQSPRRCSKRSKSPSKEPPQVIRAFPAAVSPRLRCARSYHPLPRRRPPASVIRQSGLCIQVDW